MTTKNLLTIKVNRTKMKSKFCYGESFNHNAPIVRIYTNNKTITLDIILEDINDTTILETNKKDMLVVFKYLVEYDIPFEYVV